MGAVPSGFRSSTLSAVSASGDYSTANFLFPALSASGLAFRDVKWDSNTNDIKASQSWVMRTMTLVQVSIDWHALDDLIHMKQVSHCRDKMTASQVENISKCIAKISDHPNVTIPLIVFHSVQKRSTTRGRRRSPESVRSNLLVRRETIFQQRSHRSSRFIQSYWLV